MKPLNPLSKSLLSKKPKANTRRRYEPPIEEPYQYESLADYISFLESAPNHPSNVITRERFKNGMFSSWDGGQGRWEATKNLWLNGWPEGLEKMHDALGRLEPPAVLDRRRRPRWVEDGDEFSRERVLTGHYDKPFRSMVREIRRAPTPIRITVDVEAHAFSGPDALFWRGAAGILLAESLARAGYPIEVYATSGAAGMPMQGGSYRQYVTVKVKDFMESAYLPTLIATTAHASFLRVGVFAHNISGMPNPYAGSGLGYSIGTDNQEALVKLGLAVPGVRCVSVPRLVLSFDEAQAWVHRTVEELERNVA